MKVLLCSPLSPEAALNWGAPSLGIIKIISFIKKYSPDIEILFYDPQVDSFDPLTKWQNYHIDIIGISLLHFTLLNTLEFINQFKKIHRESLIVIGGNEAAANYQDIFDKSPADIAVLAEGEDTFLNIIKWKKGEKKLEDISGIVYRKYAYPINDDMLWNYWKEVDFSQYRYQDYWRQIASLYQEPDYEKINYVRLVTTSHCQRHCTFCSLAFVRNIACGRVVKPASLKGWQIMELVDRIHKQLPDVRTLYYCTDDVFYPKKDDFLDFIELYRKSGYNYRILIQTSSYSIQEQDFPKLKEIGCRHITIGIENCSARIRETLGKYQDQQKIEDIIIWSKKYGIQLYYLIILIPPESTLEDLRINYKTLKRWLSLGVQISVEPVVYCYRGTPLYEENYQFLCERKKIQGTNLYLKDPIYILPKDPTVRELTLEFKRRERDFVEERFKDLPHQHKFKGETGPILLELLGELLEKYECSTSLSR